MQLASGFDTGTIAFMLLCTSLVMLMTPGLAFFYGGLVSKKNVVAIMAQSFISMGWTAILWFVVGYSLCFSGGVGGIIGNLDMAFLNGVTPATPTPANPALPLIIFIAYQLMSAVITPSLITGAFANRVKFRAYLIFLTFWLLFVYFPVCHMVWGDGLFAKWGIIDFAGGSIVHATAGFGALASVFFVGKRKKVENNPHSMPLFALGAAILWFGWYGFNAGSTLGVNTITAVAFFNTSMAASAATVVWLVLSKIFEKKPKLMGMLTGAVAGLVGVTPAAGFVPLWAAVVIGTVVSTVCFFAIYLKNRLGWDDALDVWGVHGMGGFTGIICTALFATPLINASLLPEQTGLLFGGSWLFFGKMVSFVLIALTWSFLFSYICLWVINKFTRVATTAQEQEVGLDDSEHGEVAYI